MPTEKRMFGDIGEEIASRYLRGKNYEILERNYRKRFGEIDIVATIKGCLVFIEVKTREMFHVKHFLPEDNITWAKKEKLRKICEIYLVDHHIPLESEWRIDVISVEIDKSSKKARINHIENAIGDTQ